jgi:maltose alpha-D-glucosyltransferase/alpha-amylase
MLNGDRRRLELAYSLLFSLPGTPIVRYGDELGMGDDLNLPERNAARTPMQWSAEPNAGFTRARKAVLPVIASGPYSYEKVNAADQRRDPQSFLNWTERMIRMRKEVPELGWGEFTVLELEESGVLAIRYDWRKASVLTLHNLRDAALEVEIALDRGQGMHLTNLLTPHHSDADRRGRHHIVLEPYGYHWYRLGGLTYLLDRASD